MLEDSIVDTLNKNFPLTLDELLESLKRKGEAVSSAELRAAVIPLINTQRLQFTKDRKLTVMNKEELEREINNLRERLGIRKASQLEKEESLDNYKRLTAKIETELQKSEEQLTLLSKSPWDRLDYGIYIANRVGDNQICAIVKKLDYTYSKAYKLDGSTLSTGMNLISLINKGSYCNFISLRDCLKSEYL